MVICSSCENSASLPASGDQRIGQRPHILAGEVVLGESVDEAPCRCPHRRRFALHAGPTRWSPCAEPACARPRGRCDLRCNALRDDFSMTSFASLNLTVPDRGQWSSASRIGAVFVMAGLAIENANSGQSPARAAGRARIHPLRQRDRLTDGPHPDVGMRPLRSIYPWSTTKCAGSMAVKVSSSKGSRGWPAP